MKRELGVCAAGGLEIVELGVAPATAELAGAVAPPG
jgi:hypothetical protein